MPYTHTFILENVLLYVFRIVTQYEKKLNHEQETIFCSRITKDLMTLSSVCTNTTVYKIMISSWELRDFFFFSFFMSSSVSCENDQNTHLFSLWQKDLVGVTWLYNYILCNFFLGHA